MSSIGTQDISRIIAEKIAAAIPEIVAQLKVADIVNAKPAKTEKECTTDSKPISKKHVEDEGSSSGTKGSSTPTEIEYDSRAEKSKRTESRTHKDQNTREWGCTYKSFLSCKPQEFKGTEGAVGVLRWIEKAESVLDICKCAEDDRVIYAAGTFQGKALTWWNHQVRNKGRNYINKMKWAEFTRMVLEEYCPRNEVKKMEMEFRDLAMVGSKVVEYTDRFHELARLVPEMVTPESKAVENYVYGLVPEIRGTITAAKCKTLRDAISLAGSLTDDAVRAGYLLKPDTRMESSGKRKFSGNFHGSNKRHNTYEDANQSVKNFGIPTTQGNNGNQPKAYVGTRPKCDKCNYHHVGECKSCSKCQRKGHTENYCRISNGPRGSCYECGATDHYRNNCPKMNNRARGRVFVLGATEEREDPDTTTSS